MNRFDELNLLQTIKPALDINPDPLGLNRFQKSTEPLHNFKMPYDPPLKPMPNLRPDPPGVDLRDIRTMIDLQHNWPGSR